MSAETRWSASARWSCRPTAILALRPRRRSRRCVRATTAATSAARGGSDDGVSATRWSTPHGPVDADDRGGELRRPPGRIGSGPSSRSVLAVRELVARRRRAEGLPEDRRRSGAARSADPAGTGRRRRRPAGPAGRRGAPRAPRDGGRRRRGSAPSRARGRHPGRTPQPRQARDLVDQQEVERVAVRSAQRLGVSRARGRRTVVGAAGRERGRRQAPSGGRPAGRSATASARSSRADLRRGEEPLEVAHPVAPVAALVDPVVAQAAGVAPGPDRVRDARRAGVRPW